MRMTNERRRHWAYKIVQESETAKRLKDIVQKTEALVEDIIKQSLPDGIEKYAKYCSFITSVGIRGYIDLKNGRRSYQSLNLKLSRKYPAVVSKAGFVPNDMFNTYYSSVSLDQLEANYPNIAVIAKEALNLQHKLEQDCNKLEKSFDSIFTVNQFFTLLPETKTILKTEYEVFEKYRKEKNKRRRAGTKNVKSVELEKYFKEEGLNERQE